MATANREASPKPRIWPRALLGAALIAGVLAWIYREPIAGYTTTGAAFGARTACSCRFIAGRGLDDCEKDFEPGMSLVFLSEDVDEKSVTARVPLLSSATARYREGYGCLLEPWDA